MTTIGRPDRARRGPSLLAAAALVLLSACSFRNVACGAPGAQESSASAATAATPVTGGGGGGGGSGAFEIAFLGDSLTAGLGLLTDQAFPKIIETQFAAEGYATVETVNAGVSGDTTAGGRQRLDQAISADTRILVVALGGNDALRGLSVQDTHDNLAAILDAALAKNVAVLLCGMEGPTNLGEDYREGFRKIYLDLTREYRGRINVLPFLLEGVAGVPALNQPDGLHPNEKGARAVADLVYPKLRAMVDQLGGG